MLPAPGAAQFAGGALAFQRTGVAGCAPIDEHGERAFFGFKAAGQHLAGRAETGAI
jgi:hypothetical protein